MTREERTYMMQKQQWIDSIEQAHNTVQLG
jgi:hypothetical protein